MENAPAGPCVGRRKACHYMCIYSRLVRNWGLQTDLMAQYLSRNCSRDIPTCEALVSHVQRTPVMKSKSGPRLFTNGVRIHEVAGRFVNNLQFTGRLDDS
jgi:hypothetical protein